ncbi:MAG: SDR family NAD(P)-dependent oxidoreductase [Bacteroidota bacterium]
MQTVLITGGSSGIGYGFSQKFAAAGYRLLWVSLPAQELADAKARLEGEQSGVEIHTLQKDLSQATAAAEVMAWTKENGWTVDVLINNAGFGTYGVLWETDLAREQAMIRLNVMNLYTMTRLFLDEMLAIDEGTIINISSNSSFQPVARMNTYASTKAFVTHFSRGLEEELRMRKAKVKVITICPAGINDTAFKASAKMEGVKTFSGLAFTTTQEVANDVWKAFQKQKSFQVSGWKMRFLYAVRNLIPYGIQQALVRRETERG